MSQSHGPDHPIVNPEIERYIESLSPGADGVRREMEEYARENGFPIVGPSVGRLLYQLTLTSGAEEIIELGSGFGYSAYWFGKALSVLGRGRVILTDASRDNAEMAEGFLSRAGLMDKVEIRVGDALEIFDGEKGPFDIVFNDVDKEWYPPLVGKAYAKLRRGGLFITDNVLWHGRVLSPEDDSPATEGVRKFARLLFAEEGFYSTVLPIRDGVSISLKL
ncbi:MAG TPA: O-methyltransferase [Thermodesulfobacteriota bacterium]|nr:O-methyltransferase [Thermodesulfobacteriota bacterium]